ncbi:UNVERIFIED_CONTAM: FT-interacting protein 3 [Sesamum calycinum]|uniref:FT-interacting protein 3 n=1 Tax=Sesamum calycinum TaxID=2727403 RepID=A0AAW2SZX0_9LAMI
MSSCGSCESPQPYAQDGQGSSNAFVELHFDGQKFRTTIKEKDLDPFWSETFYFNVSNPTDLHNLTLEAHVYSMNKNSNSKSSLGKVRITGTSFVPYSDAVVFNYPLEKGSIFLTCKRGTWPESKVEESIPDVVTNGKKGLRRTFYNLSSSNNQRQQPPPAPSQQPIQYGGDEMRSEPQAPQVVRMYAGSSSQPTDFTLRETSPILGGGQVVGGRVRRSEKPSSIYDLVEPMQFLFVRVVKAHGLPSKDLTGSLDPYVEVKLGNYKGVTKHFEKTQNPEWNTVFTFSKDRMQSSVLEVVVKDKDMVKDDFVGLVRFDLHEIPTRVPPDSPLAPQWYRLEDKKGEKQKGELMLAVWMGTQADEAFSDAWHSDAASPVDLALQHISVRKSTIPQDYVEDRLGPNKDEVLGKTFIPLATVERRADDRVVHSRWFNLQKPSATDIEEPKKDKFASRVHLRVCLDGGYHVLDESTHYSSDLRPTAKQLWKPPIGILELGILNADALTPMKTRNGRGTSDTFCVAKYGQKWVRTRTITDSLNPKYNEQYTWEVFDPATVLTVGVFDNGQIGERGSNESQRHEIGKVRIRISTLETSSIVLYSLLVLHPLTCNSPFWDGRVHWQFGFSCTS